VFYQFLQEIDEDKKNILIILSILVCQAKPGQSSELKGVHLVNCPFAK
jgi:hypothetical protein